MSNKVTQNGTENRSMQRRMNVRNMVQIAMLGAVATLLMIFEIPLWFAPSFYEMDLSEVAVLIGTFSMGPLAGAIIELIKVLLNLVINGTITAGIGELANFLIGCSFVVPAGIIYQKQRTKKGAVLGLVVGTLLMVVVGSILNAFVLLPAYAVAFAMPDITPLVQMGNKVNPAITNLSTFVLFAVVPFNLLKGIVVSLITMVLYKKVSVVLKLHH